MADRLTFDVYGRFRVVAERGDTDYLTLWVTGREGRRKRLDDVVVDSNAGPDEIIRSLEAFYHEAASPGETIVLVEA